MLSVRPGERLLWRVALREGVACRELQPGVAWPTKITVTTRALRPTAGKWKRKIVGADAAANHASGRMLGVTMIADAVLPFRRSDNRSEENCAFSDRSFNGET